MVMLYMHELRPGLNGHIPDQRTNASRTAIAEPVELLPEVELWHGPHPEPTKPADIKNKEFRDEIQGNIANNGDY